MSKKERILEILFKFGLFFSPERRELLEKNANPNEMEEILNYLINELKIGPRNIEKCPSILCGNLSSIKANYQFLENNNLYNYSIETCLHILSTNEEKLKSSFEFVKEKYG